MFTGIVEKTGKIYSIRRMVASWRVGIETSYQDICPGESIAVNGACLTAVEQGQSVTYFEVVKPTLDATNLKRFQTGQSVNLERALIFGKRVSGHFVLGHIDCEGKIVHLHRRGDFYICEVVVPKSWTKYIVEKGSIALDGVSLTVAQVHSGRFTVHIIPFTFSHTIFHQKKTGSFLNIEFDYLLKAIPQGKALPGYD